MVKWTKYCYKRWLWTFGALAELDVVVANINIQLTAFALYPPSLAGIRTVRGGYKRPPDHKC